MKRCIGEPPGGVFYPIWAWHSLDNKPVKVDLRRSEFNNYCGDHYILTIDVPYEQVLLSDEESWHFVLNNWFLSDAKSEKDFDKAEAWFDSLSLNEQRQVKEKSWESIFDVNEIVNISFHEF